MKKDCVRLSISLVESFLHGMSVKIKRHISREIATNS